MIRSAHHVFLARGADRVGEPSEANEGRFEWIPLADVPDLVAPTVPAEWRNRPRMA